MTGIRNPSALIIGLVLSVVTAVTVWDAMNMRIRATYGLGADVTSYIVAAFIGALAIAHIVVAFRPRTDAGVGEPMDWKAVGWVALALGGLVASIWLKGGFILGSTLLFVFTARAFGKNRMLLDLLIGFLIAVLVYLLFHGVLKLTLPEGPLERLL